MMRRAVALALQEQPRRRASRGPRHRRTGLLSRLASDRARRACIARHAARARRDACVHGGAAGCARQRRARRGARRAGRAPGDRGEVGRAARAARRGSGAIRGGVGGTARGPGDRRGLGARRLLATVPSRGAADRERAHGHRSHAAQARRARGHAIRVARRRPARRVPRERCRAHRRHRRPAHVPVVRLRRGGQRRARGARRAAVRLRFGHARRRDRAGRGRQHRHARGRRRAQAARLPTRHHQDQRGVPASEGARAAAAAPAVAVDARCVPRDQSRAAQAGGDDET